MENILKIGFISHDWKEQMDHDELNNIMKSIGEPITITEINTDSDEYTFAVHNSSIDLPSVLTNEEISHLWERLFPLLRYGDTEIYEDNILQYYKNDIVIVPIDVFKSWLN